MISSSDYNNDCDNSSDDSDADLAYSEGDCTLMDDDVCDASNEAKTMLSQIVEILRYQDEVCVLLLLNNFVFIKGFFVSLRYEEMVRS